MEENNELEAQLVSLKLENTRLRNNIVENKPQQISLNESNMSGSEANRFDNSPQSYYGNSRNMKHSRQVYRSKRESLNEFAPISKPYIDKIDTTNEDSSPNILTDRNSDKILKNNIKTKFSLVDESKSFNPEQIRIKDQRVGSNLIHKRASRRQNIDTTYFLGMNMSDSEIPKSRNPESTLVSDSATAINTALFEGRKSIEGRKIPNLKLLEDSSSVISGYRELADSFTNINDGSSFKDITRVRVKGRNNQYEFKHGQINITLDEQQQLMLKRKAIKQAHERLRNLDVLQKERAEKAKKEIEKIQKEKEEINLLHHRRRIENTLKRKKIAEFKERYIDVKHKRSKTKNS